MADAAHFIVTMNKEKGYTENQKWILFGGSYAGAMSVWFRVKYPNLAYGAISSSGPVAPVVNFAGLTKYNYYENLINELPRNCMTFCRILCGYQ